MKSIGNRTGGRLPLVAIILVCSYVNSFAAAKETWPHTWGGGFNDYASSAALDSQGNIYVAGTTNSFGAGGADVLILKYGQGGVFKWAKTWGGSGNDYASRIAVGPDGNIYVTGLTSSFGAGWSDVFLLKLDSDGNLKSGETWGGSSYEGGYDIGFDQAGDVYVVGESYSNGRCVVLLKFSSTTGALLWSTSWKGPATYDSGYSLAVDAAGDVIVSGISWDYSVQPNHNSILIVKYDSSGNYKWSENWITPTPGEDESGNYHALTTDASNNIYIGARHSSDCQSSNFSQCDFDALVLKLDATGNLKWADTWGSPGYDSAGGIALDPTSHNLRVSGIQDAYGSPALFVSSYDPSGNLLSVSGWGGQQTVVGSTIPGLAMGSTGNVWVVAGASDNSGTWAATSATTGTLVNSLVSNPYTLGTPVGTIHHLTNPTQSQNGIMDVGGGEEDALITEFLGSN